MAGANSVASVDPASTTKSYTKPTVYIAPAASITQSGELLRLATIGIILADQMTVGVKKLYLFEIVNSYVKPAARDIG